MDRPTSSYIRDILIQEMQIPVGNIWIRDQNTRILNETDTYISLGMVDTVVMSNRTLYKDDPGGLLETQRITMKENIQIDIFSRDNSAVLRRWEVPASMTSTFSTQVQEENGFKIFRIPETFANTSETEGSERINKFSIIIPAFVWYSKSKPINAPSGDFYDDFDARVDDENTIGQVDGLIEFNIKGDVIT